MKQKKLLYIFGLVTGTMFCFCKASISSYEPFTSQSIVFHDYHEKTIIDRALEKKTYLLNKSISIGAFLYFFYNVRKLYLSHIIHQNQSQGFIIYNLLKVIPVIGIIPDYVNFTCATIELFVTTWLMKNIVKFSFYIL